MPLRRCAGTALLVLIGACGSDPTPTETQRAVALALRDGNDQSGPAGGILNRPLSVAAVDDKQNPVPGTVVRFRVTRGAQVGTILLDTIAVAGFDGVAAVRLRLGSVLDTSIVEASLPDLPNATTSFRAVATPPPRLDAVIPLTFASGDTVRLRGQSFSTASDGNTALFGTARGRLVRRDSDTSLTVVVPPCVSAGIVNTRVVVGTVTTNAVSTTVAGISGLLRLGPLEGVTVSGADLGNCIQLAGGGASYLVVPQSAAQGVGSRRVEFAVSANAAALGELPRVTPLAIEPAAPPQTATPPVDRRFDLALREREAALVDAARKAGQIRASPEAIVAQRSIAAPAVGSQRTFQVLSSFDGSTFKRVTARLRYAGDHILLYVDVDQPPGALTDSDLRTFGDLFDGSLYDIGVRAFGSESDIDANGRVIFVLTPVVNALTPGGECAASGFITGFHYGLDLLPNQASSNRGEIFYALVPDLGGTRSCEHTKADVERLVPATFVHEFST